ncbi:hypothetical protein [Nonomuraea sp. NPDC049695]|uniref:hypothetical protein n=1 Tax=Nonomuraea sp. NPDC049695 TaxID=3154734 RepID=UPI00342BD054
MAFITFRTSIAALAVAGAATTGLAALPAVADASGATSASAMGTASGSCSKGGPYINFTGHYHNSSRYHVFTKFSWTIGGSGVRNKNNVEFRVKHDNRLGHDPIYWTWKSPDNIRKGYSEVNSGTQNGGNPVPRSGIRVPKNKAAYVEFKVVFDKRGTDPRCSGHTRNV